MAELLVLFWTESHYQRLSKYTWKLYDFINWRHPNNFIFKKLSKAYTKQKFIEKLRLL